MALERIAQILRGKNVKPLTEMESAVKYAVDNAGSGGGGSDLPAVTSADNGDVLTVVEGAWAKAAQSGVGYDFIIQIDISTTPATITLASGDFSTAFSKASQGKPLLGVVFVPPNEDFGAQYYPIIYIWSGNVNGTDTIQLQAVSMGYDSATEQFTFSPVNLTWTASGIEDDLDQ